MDIIEYINNAKTDEDIINLFKNDKKKFKYKYTNDQNNLNFFYSYNQNIGSLEILHELSYIFSYDFHYFDKHSKYFNYFKGIYYLISKNDHENYANGNMYRYDKKKHILMKKYYGLNIKLQFYVTRYLYPSSFPFTNYHKYKYYTKKYFKYSSNNLIFIYDNYSLNNYYYSYYSFINKYNKIYFVRKYMIYFLIKKIFFR